MDIFTVQQDQSTVQDTSPTSALITPNTSIASVAIGNDHHIRVYFQDTEGYLWETEYRDGIRKSGARIKTAFQAKPNTPLAAITYCINGVNHIRLFYVNMNNILQEHYWDQSVGKENHWSTGTGALGESKMIVDYRSNIAACAWIANYGERMMVYYQAPYQHDIHEVYWCPVKEYDSQIRGYIQPGWGKNISSYSRSALFGSGLAAISNTHASNVTLYYQHALDRTVREWRKGVGSEVTLGEAISGTAIAAIKWRSTPDSQIRVYYESTDGVIAENGYGMNHVQAWSGPRKLTKSLMGTSLSTCSWSSGSTTHIRVYLQQEEGNVMEYCGIGEWAQGAVVKISG